MELEKYENFFRCEGRLSCLHIELLLDGSYELCDPLIIFHENIWHAFIKLSKKSLSLTKGLELFSNQDKYDRYSVSFRSYINKLKKLEIKNLTQETLFELIKFIGKFWKYYGYSEYFYTDLAYELSKDNPLIRKNLEDLKILKNEGREALNFLMFDEGIFPKVLTTISKRFLEESEDVFFLYSDELLNLFEGKKPSKEIIEKRKKSLVIAKINKVLIKYDYGTALELAKEFIKINQTSIKGISANKGRARGRVIIAPMLTNSEKVKELFNKMKQGDILVAQSTSPELCSLVKKASAIVTDQGGMLSHAAIISREFDIPCIVGTKNTTRILHDYDLIDVDADKGIVMKLEDSK